MTRQLSDLCPADLPRSRVTAPPARTCRRFARARRRSGRASASPPPPPERPLVRRPPSPTCPEYSPDRRIVHTFPVLLLHCPPFTQFRRAPGFILFTSLPPRNSTPFGSQHVIFTSSRILQLVHLFSAMRDAPDDYDLQECLLGMLFLVFLVNGDKTFLQESHVLK